MDAKKRYLTTKDPQDINNVNTKVFLLTPLREIKA
jgi:hypothetical protein